MWRTLLPYVKFPFSACPWRPDFLPDVNLETVPLSGWHFLGRAAILRLLRHWNVFIRLSHYLVRCCFPNFYQSEFFMRKCFPFAPIFYAHWSKDLSACPACCCVKWENFCTENLIFEKCSLQKFRQTFPLPSSFFGCREQTVVPASLFQMMQRLWLTCLNLHSILCPSTARVRWNVTHMTNMTLYS